MIEDEDDFAGESGDVGEILERCREDAVIVVVYREQKISVPFSMIEEMGPKGYGYLTRSIAVKLLENHGLSVKEGKPSSFRARLFNEPAYDIIGLGHAGVCAIDGIKQEAYYFEFGRYGDANGIVRESNHFGKSYPVIYDGKNPALSALKSLCERLRLTNSDEPINFEGIYVKTHCGFAKRLIAAAKSQMPNRRGPYSLVDNHCMTFAIDMAAVAGVDVSAARQATGFDLTDEDEEMVRDEVMAYDVGMVEQVGAWLLDVDIDGEKEKMLAGIINNLEGEISSMVPPSHMMEKLQQIWNRLNHAPFDFEGFQERPLQKKS